MKKRWLLVFSFVIAMVLASTSVSLGASTTKKMTTYSDVIKSGKYAYCIATKGLYRVNLISGDKKRLVKATTGEEIPFMMKLHKGYLYYQQGGAICSSLNRIKTNGKHKRYLASTEGSGYVISKGKIYYKAYKDLEDFKVVKRKMKLNGKKKSATSVKIKTTTKISNNKGYKVKSVLVARSRTPIQDEYMDYEVYEKWTDYLFAPGGKVYKLCSYSYEFQE